MEDEEKDSRERGWCLQKRKLEDGERRDYAMEKMWGTSVFSQKNLWGE